MRVEILLSGVVGLALGACERHSWEGVTDGEGKVIEEGTKTLFEEHHPASHGQDDPESGQADHPGDDGGGEGGPRDHGDREGRGEAGH